MRQKKKSYRLKKLLILFQMIEIESLVNILKRNNSDFYTGVPDSILKELSMYLQNKKNHIVATNEGSAISIGIGYYLSTKKIPVIYMQNSGLSNAINPLISIANKNVYSIPLILIIGWRGSPNINDEPQHVEKGKITRNLLDLLKIKYTIIENTKDLKKFASIIKNAKKNNEIAACLIKKGTIKKSFSRKKINKFNLDKEYFLKILLENLNKKSQIISSTGYNSREIMFVRKKYNIRNGKDFYMVGGMGHTSSVALGYSLKTKKKIICIDGDGSFLMHLGSIKSVGSFGSNNLKYILLNNNTHDSVGGQSTFMNNVNIKKLTNSLGFKNYYKITSKLDINKKLKSFLNSKKLSFLEVCVSNCKLKNLPRPINLKNIKKIFMS